MVVIGKSTGRVDHPSTSFRAATNAARSSSVLTSVEATSSRSPQSGIGGEAGIGHAAQNTLVGHASTTAAASFGSFSGEFVEEGPRDHRDPPVCRRAHRRAPRHWRG